MLSTPDFTTAVTTTLENGINTALKYDPATQAKLTNLCGNILKLECTDPVFELYFIITDTQIKVQSVCESNADVSIIGSATDFLSMLGDSPHSFADSDISIAGKVSVLNQIKIILMALEIDWEEIFSDVVGVLPANALAQMARMFWRWLRQRENECRKNLPEYLSEEIQVIPSRAEMEIFYREVDDMKAAVCRADAKLQKIIQNINIA